MERNGRTIWCVMARPRRARGGRQPADVLAAQQYPSGVRSEDTGNDLQQSGLAGPVRSDQSNDVAIVHRERHVGEDLEAAEPDRNGLNLQGICHALRNLCMSDVTIPANPPGAKRMMSTRSPPKISSL